jgi:hypothetical protein
MQHQLLPTRDNDALVQFVLLTWWQRAKYNLKIRARRLWDCSRTSRFSKELDKGTKHVLTAETS